MFLIIFGLAIVLHMLAQLIHLKGIKSSEVSKV